MEVEFISEFTQPMSHNPALQIVKGKRTKRQRPCSPSHADCSIDNFASEEDEDMANCLIMLAQSVVYHKSDQIRQKTERLSSRRLTEMTSAFSGNGGCYVYECKTCNRTFPSFQALGGHRASHKKPKVINVEEKKSGSVSMNMNMNNLPPLTEYSDEVHDQQKTVIEHEERNSSTIVKSPSPSPGIVQTGIANRGKVHECSICGSEFSSGQALGGHMRKHRPVPPSVNRTESVTEKSPGGSTSTLSLDLNFPPPEAVDDGVESKFQFTGGSSQPHLVFSAPALVGCHY